MAAAYRGDTFRAMVLRPILAAILCSAALAHGSPRTDPTAGRAVFTGATLPNATSIGLNPAALGTGTFGEVFIALTGVLEQYRIDKREIDGAPSPGGRARAIETTPGGMLGRPRVLRLRNTAGSVSQSSDRSSPRPTAG